MREFGLVYVVDANILIDVHSGGIVREFFMLPYIFRTTDANVSEMEEPSGDLLLSYGLQMRSISEDDMNDVYDLRNRYRNVSIQDVMVLVLARIEQTVLLTGDGFLRRVAEKERVPVHGTLWVLDKMVDLSVISQRSAADALSLMQSRGRRLPHEECEQRLQRWLADPSSTE